MNGEHEETLLEGKVAQILNEREIAITIGRKQGVTKGMRFAILATPQEVRDPDTNEVLDTIDREKVEVEATEVRERITICSTFRTSYNLATLISSPVLKHLLQIQSAFALPQQEVETLWIQDSSLPAPLDPAESYVKIGDRVRQVAVPSLQASREMSAAS